MHLTKISRDNPSYIFYGWKCITISRFNANPNATSATFINAVGTGHDEQHPAFSALTKIGFTVAGFKISLNSI